MVRKLWTLSRYSMLSGIALLLGFARELVVSSKFGLSRELDVYLAMLGFHLFFGTQIGNALEMVFVSRAANLDTARKVTIQLAKILKVLGLVNVLIIGVLYGTSDYLVAWIFPGFGEDQRQLGGFFIANLLLAIAFANISGVIRAGLNVLRVFWPGMMAGSVISASGIVAVVLFGDEIGVRALLYGFVVGNGLVFILLSLVFARYANFSYREPPAAPLPSRSGFWKAVVVVLTGEVFYQAFSMTERGFASTFEAGTLSAFSYAWILVTIPLTLVVMPLSTVAYPRLAEAFGQDRWHGYARLKRYGGGLFLFGLAMVGILSGFSDSLVKLVFMRGKFTGADAEKTSQILSILIFALPFMSFGRLARYSLYSIANYTGPVWALLAGWLVMASLAWALTPVYGINGLACSSMAAMATEALAMLLILRIGLEHAPAQSLGY